MHPGDHVWWDLHDWSADRRTCPPSSAPSPSRSCNGIGGKRLPRARGMRRGRQAPPAARSTARLRALGVPAGDRGARAGGGGARNAARARRHVDRGARRPGRGEPRAGAARRAACTRGRPLGGGTLTLLDAARRDGAHARRRRGAARRHPHRGAEAPVWLVTGTDAAGVQLAARRARRARRSRPLRRGARGGRRAGAAAGDARRGGVTVTRRPRRLLLPPPGEPAARHARRASARCGRSRSPWPRCCSSTRWCCCARCSAVLAARPCGAGSGRLLARALRIGAIVAVPIVAVNVLVSRQGLTVFARLGDLGPFGQGDLTVEALVYGAVIALKVDAAGADHDARQPRRSTPTSCCGSCRGCPSARPSPRRWRRAWSPLLAADARRLAEAQRTRPDGGAQRRARARRAARRRASPARSTARWTSPPRSRCAASPRARRAPRLRRPWSRHDLAFAPASRAVLALLAVVRRPRRARSAARRRFCGAYPQLHHARRAAPDDAVALCAALCSRRRARSRSWRTGRGIEP